MQERLVPKGLINLISIRKCEMEVLFVQEVSPTKNAGLKLE